MFQNRTRRLYVDNGGQGGVFASIDEKGVVITEADNCFGHKFAVHPDSGKKFIGYEIPQWEGLIHLVEEAHTICFPTTKFISWDFALTDAGWVVVELGWGQMSAQVSLQKGLKREFLQLLLGE